MNANCENDIHIKIPQWVVLFAHAFKVICVRICHWLYYGQKKIDEAETFLLT